MLELVQIIHGLRGDRSPLRFSKVWPMAYASDGEDEDDWYDTDDEMEERAQYCGHTRADFEELMCQGIKPWDVMPGDLPWNDL